MPLMTSMTCGLARSPALPTQESNASRATATLLPGKSRHDWQPPHLWWEVISLVAYYEWGFDDGVFVM